MKIYFATWLAEKNQGIALTKTKERKRLLSYHFIKEQKATKQHLQRYMRRGVVSLRKKK